MFIASSSEVSGEVPGLQSVASAIGTPCGAQGRDRRQPGLAHEVEGAGQQRRRPCPAAAMAAAPASSRYSRWSADRAPCSAASAAAVEVGELVGVQLDRQAVRPWRPRTRGDLGRRKGDALAEGVDRVGQALGGDRGIISRHTQVDIALAIAGELRRQGVGPRNVVAIVHRTAPARARAARSWRISASG